MHGSALHVAVKKVSDAYVLPLIRMQVWPSATSFYNVLHWAQVHHFQAIPSCLTSLEGVSMLLWAHEPFICLNI